jgi:hypothetical protein
MSPDLEVALAQLEPPRRQLKVLVPSYLDPGDWRPRSVRAPAGWQALRARALRRDSGCVYCGQGESDDRHARLEVNHLNGYRDNRLEALETVCVLCHRVLHGGRSGAIFGSLLLYRVAGCDQNTLIRLCWMLRTSHHMRDRELMALLELKDSVPFRMDRAYLAGLVGYVVESFWLLERGGG